MFDNFKNEWLGRRIDWDRVYAYQCVDLILQYAHELFGVNGAYGNAIDFWTNPDAKLLVKFHKIASNEAQKGDIVIFKTRGHEDFGGEGHIGIATGNIDASNVEVLEQNGQTGNGSGVGGDAIRVRYIARSRVAGLLRPNEVVQPSAPAPASHPYTIENITPKRIKFNKPTHRWGMNYDNFTAIASNPQETVNANEERDVVAICHHNIGYNYYLTDANNPSGYNVLDCDDVPVPPPPAPVVVPPPAPPAGPYPIPAPKKHTLSYEVNGYINATNAGNHTDPIAKVAPNEYFVFNTYPGKENLVNLSSINGKAGYWVNTEEDVKPPEPIGPKQLTPEQLQAIKDSWNPPAPVVVPEPAPAPVVVAPPEPVLDTEAKVRTSLIWFMPDHSPIDCKLLKDVLVTEVFNKRVPIQGVKGREIQAFGTFMKDHKCYALVRLASDKNFEYLYGVPVKSHTNLLPYLDDLYNIADKIKYGFERAYDTMHKTIDGFFRQKKR